MTKSELIEALSNYFCISDDINSYDWQSGCTILGDDNEYRWMTLANIMEALDDYIEDDDEYYED